GIRQRQPPRSASGPTQYRERNAKRGKQRETGRHQRDRERQQPAERLGVDQERVADPIEPGEEISESEPPARGRCRNEAAPAAGRRPVDEPDQDRERQERRRPYRERR